ANTFSAAEDEGIFYSGYSKSMTSNKDRLDDFQAIHGGKVTFGGGEGRITGKGTIRTPTLDFENVYYVKELQQFNLFSISQICDKKNQVLFTDTECLVLSKDFKLLDNSMMVLKVFFLEHKDETYPIFKNFINLVENQLNKKVKAIRCDNGTEFKNIHMIELYGSKGIKGEYSNPRTPQQNRIAERKNRTLIEAAKTMLADSKLPTMFWTEAVRTACYALNKVSITSPYNKTPYALLTGNIPTVSRFKPFGCHVTILNTSDHLGKFDGKADEGYIVGYSASNKAYRVYNVPNKRVEETMNLCVQESQPIDTSGDKFDDSSFPSADEIFQKELAKLKDQEQRVTSDAEELRTPAGVKAVLPGCIQVPTGRVPVPAGSLPVPTADSMFDGEPTTRFPCPSDLGNHNPSPGIFSSSSYDDEFDTALNNVASSMEVSPVPTKRIHTIHPQSLIIRDPTSVVQMRSMVKQNTTVEPRSVAQALADPTWVDAMQEEMQQFKFQNVWVLVDLPPGKYAIGTKWILKNKRDARGIVVRNKARLVAQGHRLEDGIDYDEVFTPVARIESIRLFLAFVSYMGFLVYQMDVKSAFIYRRIEEEVYVTQPKGFVDPQHPKKVYNVVKALYGLHQAPRAWYATLSTFLLKHGYRRGTIDKTFFLKKNNRDIILLQVYVDDIVFGSTKKEWCNEFEALMKGEHQMSAIGELIFFLGQPLHLMKLQSLSLMYLTASRPDIMFAVSACLRHQVTPTTSNLEAVKKIFKYLKGQPKLGLWYPKEPPLVLEAYSDSDYAGLNLLDLTPRAVFTSHLFLQCCPCHGMSCLRGSGLNIGIPPCKIIVLQSASHKFDLIRRCAIANAKHELHLLKPSSEFDNSLSTFEVQRFAFQEFRHKQSSMAALQYKAEHNKVGYLLKPTGSDDYHNIIDFLRSLHIRAPELGPPAILATIDRTPYTITEELVRSSLQLADDGGVTDLPILEIYSGMDALGYVTEETRVTRQYKVLVFSSKLFANIRLNFTGNPIPLLPAMLLQAQAGEGAKVATQDVPHPVPAPDQSPAHLPTPSRPQSPDHVAPVLEHDHSSAQPDTGAGSFPTTEDAPLGGNFHTSPPRSSHTLPAGQPLGGVEDPITLTALSSVVSTLVQKVHSLEAELHDHKKLFKDVVGKLVKKVKTLEVKLKTKKRKMVVSDSDEKDGTTPNVDLDALRALANAAVAVDSNVPFDSTSQIPTASPCAPSITLTAASAVPADSSKVPAAVPADSLNVPAGVSSKGKSPTVEEDIHVTARSFRQREEDRLCDQERLWDEFYRLETSMEDVEGVCGIATYMEQKGKMWPTLGSRNVLRCF
nr:hypothetical protein [Tanacetum cinerariifolium]